MMANLDCKLDRTQNHLGDTLSGVSEDASTEIYLRQENPSGIQESEKEGEGQVATLCQNTDAFKESYPSFRAKSDVLTETMVFRVTCEHVTILI